MYVIVVWSLGSLIIEKYLTCILSVLAAFLIGRQILVTVCTFFIARITTPDPTSIRSGENIFGVSDGAQALFNTGLLGAFVTTVLASLAWRIVAASFPVGFLSNPLVYVILRLCLIIEATGVCSAAWLLALINKQIFGYQDDQVYIGRPEDSMDASTKKERQSESLELEAGHDD